MKLHFTRIYATSSSWKKIYKGSWVFGRFSGYPFRLLFSPSFDFHPSLSASLLFFSSNLTPTIRGFFAFQSQRLLHYVDKYKAREREMIVLLKKPNERARVYMGRNRWCFYAARMSIGIELFFLLFFRLLVRSKRAEYARTVLVVCSLCKRWGWMWRLIYRYTGAVCIRMDKKQNIAKDDEVRAVFEMRGFIRAKLFFFLHKI